MPSQPQGLPRSTVRLHAPRTPDEFTFWKHVNACEWSAAIRMVEHGVSPGVMHGDVGQGFNALHAVAWDTHVPEAVWRTVLAWGLPLDEPDGYGKTAAQTLVGHRDHINQPSARGRAGVNDHARAMLHALVEQGARHGLADSVPTHVPLVLHAALNVQNEDVDGVQRAFEVLPPEEFDQAWSMAFWAAALHGKTSETLHRWLMQHPPVWDNVDWTIVPSRTIEPFNRTLGKHLNVERRNLSSIALLTSPGLHDRFEEVVVGHRAHTPDALAVALQAWGAVHRFEKHARILRSDRARQARMLIKAGASLVGEVVHADGTSRSVTHAVDFNDPAFKALYDKLAEQEVRITSRLLRREVRALRDEADRPLTVQARARARL